MKSTPKPFTGTIDQLLNHCSTDEQLHESCEDDHLTYEEAVKLYMEEMEVSQEEAESQVEEVMLEEFNKTIDNMVKDGLLKITGYTEKGEPKYGPTELGSQVTDEIVNQRIDPSKN